MAVRIHVTAVRDCPGEEVRTTFNGILGAGFEAVQLHETNGWTWFTTSVWGVGADDLNKGLCQLARPAMQFTTSDGDRWYLTLHGTGRGREVFVHEFSYLSRKATKRDDKERAEQAAEHEDDAPTIDPALAFLEQDDPEELESQGEAKPKRPRSAFSPIADELESMGAPLPDSFLDEVGELPYSKALNRFREWYADRLIDSLGVAGIPCEAAAVRDVLLWKTVTDNERSGDLGNLPRLLAALRLGDDWDQYILQAEAPVDNDEDYDQSSQEQVDETPPIDVIATVTRLVGELPITPLRGKPVGLPLQRIGLVGFCAECCATDTDTLLMTAQAKFPEPLEVDALTSSLLEDLRGRVDVQLTIAEDRIQIGMTNYQLFTPKDLRSMAGKVLSKQIFSAPEGTELEVAFASEGCAPTYQRYIGVVNDGKWRIESSTPALTREALMEALELAKSDEKTEFEARDEAEAEAILKASETDEYLHNMGVKREGLTVKCEYDAGFLARVVFRERCRDFWDFGPYFAHVRQEHIERVKQQREMRRAAVEAARRRAAPHDSTVLLRGKHSIYWKSDFTAMTELDQSQREAFDAATAELGFHLIGDLVVKKQRDIVLRVVVDAPKIVYAILMGKRTMYLSHEFVTLFVDGSSLTTTTNSMVDSHPEVGIYYRAFPGMEIKDLHAKHVQGIQRFRKRKGIEPIAIEPTLLGAAQRIDEAFERQSKVVSDEFLSNLDV